MLPITSRRYHSHSQPQRNCQHFPVPLSQASLPLVAVIWMSHETLLSSLPVVGGEKRREGWEAEAGEKWLLLIMEVLAPPWSCVRSGTDGWWDTSTSLTTPGEAGGGVFLVRAVSWGVGACFQEVLHCRRGGAGFPSSGRTHRDLCHPLHSQSPAELAARDGQQNTRGWKCWGERLGCFW